MPQGAVGVYVMTGARVCVGFGLLLLGLGLEVVLYKRLVFGKAEPGETEFQSIRATLFHHMSYIALRQEQLYDAFFAGTILIEAFFSVLGFDLDVG